MGGIGGLLAAALARTDATCVVLLRPETLARYAGRITVESAVLWRLRSRRPRRVVARPGSRRPLDRNESDTARTRARTRARRASRRRNGDPTHERRRPRRSAPRSLPHRHRRRDPGRVGTTSAGSDPPEVSVPACRAGRRRTGRRRVVQVRNQCCVRDDERSLLWEKLAFLAPVALATTALDATLGAVRHDERYNGCRDEALAIARAEGAEIDEAALFALQRAAPSEMRSSMQKDVAGGREPELDAIAGPILRGSRRHAIPVPSTEELVRLVASRLVGQP